MTVDGPVHRSDWTPCSGVSRVPHGARYALLELLLASAPGEAYLDDISLTAVPGNSQAPLAFVIGALEPVAGDSEDAKGVSS